MVVTAAVIRIKLVDLLKILCEPLPKEVRTKPDSPRQTRLTTSGVDEHELEAIRTYLMCQGPAKSIDLQFEFNMSRGTVLHRLDLLKGRGVVEDLPGYRYGLKGV